MARLLLYPRDWRFSVAAIGLAALAWAATAAAAPLHLATTEELRDLARGASLFNAPDQEYAALNYCEATWQGSTFWTGPDWTRVGKDWQHSGETTPSVRRWNAPRDGRVTITGRVYKADTNGGDGVRVSIRHERREAWKAEIEANDAKGVEPNVTLDVRRGDAIRFVVHKRGGIGYDSTHWDPVVAYADGPTYRASESFAAKKQGEGGWSYEMEVNSPDPTAAPRIHAFGAEGFSREDTVQYARPVTLSDKDALPLVVIADSGDRKGVIFALAGDGPWRLKASMSPSGRLQLAVDDGSGASPARTPSVALGQYQGKWVEGMTQLQAFVRARSTGPAVNHVRQTAAAALDRAMQRLGGDTMKTMSLDYWAMIQADWRQQDKLVETPDAYAKATADHLAKAAKLLADLRHDGAAGLLAEEAEQLDRLKQAADKTSSLDARRELYLQARLLKRRIALANPKVQFGKMLFTKRVPPSYSHLVMQYYGWRARPGGGLFILDEPGRSLACRDILDGRLAGGCVLEPRLSFDAKKIVFSYVANAGKTYDPGTLWNERDEGFYHIYEVNVDGSGLRQLTSGAYDDVMPTYLPDGGIVFCSTRRKSYGRCFHLAFSHRWHVYTLHRMDADGGNMRMLSFHDTNEWFPAISPSGHILYARWDYIDRDAVTHQNLWATRPDGTNPVAVWGNATPKPHCTFQAQPIPDSNKIVFTASAHHSITGGPIVILDPSIGVDGQEALARITPDVPFPEAEIMDIKEYYASPWPLSEKYFLVSYCPTPLVWEPGANEPAGMGIYLLDVFGNRELIYRDPAIGSENACPLVARPTPPVLPSELPSNAPPTGEMILADIYQGLGDVPRGSIKELRVVQIFPKAIGWGAPIGAALEENGRAILGTVPVEADGSARFTVPAATPVLFQALDKDGFAYQTMRSLTYVQPGEKVSCVGCHEARMSAPVRKSVMAMRRPASVIKPGPLDGSPFSYVRTVQPIWDKHCVSCHGGDKPSGKLDLTGAPQEPFSRSYRALCGGDLDFWADKTNPDNAAKALVPRFGARNQIQMTAPGGMYGALGSRLIKILREGHENVVLSPEEMRRLATWIDMNAIFYGVHTPEEQARQLRGEIVPMPEVR